MNDMSINTQKDIAAAVADLGKRGKAAARQLAIATDEQRNLALTEAAKALRACAADILIANAKDVEGVRDGGKDAAFIDRLTLTQDRVDGMIGDRQVCFRGSAISSGFSRFPAIV
jgi:glutamate-5-semialdehyde dehydrogenase